MEPTPVPVETILQILGKLYLENQLMEQTITKLQPSKEIVNNNGSVELQTAR